MISPFLVLLAIAILALAIALLAYAMKDGKASTTHYARRPQPSGQNASGAPPPVPEDTLEIRTRYKRAQPYRASMRILIAVGAVLLAMMFGEWIMGHLEEDLKKNREAACCREEASVAPRQSTGGSSSAVPAGFTDKVNRIEKELAEVQRDVVGLKATDRMFTNEFAARSGNTSAGQPPTARAPNGVFGSVADCLSFHRGLFGSQKGYLANTVPDDAAVERFAREACAAMGPDIKPS